MSAPLTAAQIRAAFDAEGVNSEEWHDWLATDRPGPFAPNGVMIHHTGSNTGDPTGRSYVRSILRPGYAGLPGPLCMAGIAPNGKVILLSRQDANHAGGGCPHVLDAVVGEASWLMDREAKPTRRNANGIDGNARFYGFEIMYSGGRPMSAAQLDQAVRAAAALCRAHGWSARSVIGHREWSLDKSDPGCMNMVTFRRLVQARLDKPAGGDTEGVKRATVEAVVKSAAAKVVPALPTVTSSVTAPTPKKENVLDMTESELRAIVRSESKAAINEMLGKITTAVWSATFGMSRRGTGKRRMAMETIGDEIRAALKEEAR